MEDTIFAGLSCEYEATVFCNKLDETNSNSFCTNGGKCKQMMEDEDDGVHYGCTCIDNYTGDVSINSVHAALASIYYTNTNEYATLSLLLVLRVH